MGSEMCIRDSFNRYLVYGSLARLRLVLDYYVRRSLARLMGSPKALPALATHRKQQHVIRRLLLSSFELFFVGPHALVKVSADI